jgi:hypothetical protein
MVLLIFLVVAVLCQINALEIIPPSSIIEPQIPVDISIKRPPPKDDGMLTNVFDIVMFFSCLDQPIAIEGEFIVAEGNSDHLFRPYDFIKKDAIQLGEGDTKDTKTDDKVR